VLGVTGAISRLARVIPQSVSVSLQLGFGLLMGFLGLKLILATPWVGFDALALVFALQRIRTAFSSALLRISARR
jgi:xanthine/uracil/vitamin C permease (AzgA family)